MADRFAQVMSKEMPMKKYVKPSLRGLGLLRMVTAVRMSYPHDDCIYCPPS